MMDSQDPSSFPAAFRRTYRIPDCRAALAGGRFSSAEISLQMVEQRQRIAAHMLSWLQDQPSHRARWHRAITDLDLSSPGLEKAIAILVAEAGDLRLQYPFGLPPKRSSEALLLQSRLSILQSELNNLKLLMDYRDA